MGWPDEERRCTTPGTPCPIEPIQFGRLLEHIDNLNRKVDNLLLTVQSLQETRSVGKGIAIGIAALCGGTFGAGVTKIIEKLSV